MYPILLSSFIGLVFLLIVDNIYLSLTKNNLYKPIIDPNENINIPSAVLCWILIIISIQLLVMSRPDVYHPTSSALRNTLLFGAFLGMSSYGLYNLTNFATYPSKWSVKIAICDTLWGTFITSLTSFVIYKSYSLINE